MWLITPTSAVVIVFLTWVLLCWIRIWSFTPGSGRFGIVCAAGHHVIRGAIRVLYAFFGMYLLDIVIRICFLGMFSYGRLGYVIIPILLCAGLGIAYIFCSSFIAPSWATLLAFGVVASTYLYMTLKMPEAELRIALYVGVALVVPLTCVEIVWTILKGHVANKKSTGQNTDDLGQTTEKHDIFSRLLWDISPRFKFLKGAKIYAIMLIIITLELILQFEGMSLLSSL
jgi:hypothetical protein